jgi:hypothetical protein
MHGTDIKLFVNTVSFHTAFILLRNDYLNDTELLNSVSNCQVWDWFDDYQASLSLRSNTDCMGSFSSMCGNGLPE